jgi:hypothetical protein
MSGDHTVPVLGRGDHVDAVQDPVEGQVDGEQQPVTSTRVAMGVLAVHLGVLAEHVGPRATVTGDGGFAERVDPDRQPRRAVDTTPSGPVGEPLRGAGGGLIQPRWADGRHGTQQEQTL